MRNQPALGGMAVPAGFVVREVAHEVLVVRAEDADALAPFLPRPFGELAALPGALRVTSGRAGPVHLPVGSDGRRVFVRPYAPGGVLAALRPPTFPDPGRALRELAVNARATGLGLPVAPLVAVTASRRAARAWRLLAWSWWLPEASPLAGALHDAGPGGGALHHLLAAVAAALKACHDAGLRHADLNAGNILVEPAAGSPRILLIDLDKAEFVPTLAWPDRVSQLGRLHRSLAKEGLLPRPVTPEAFLICARAAVGAGLDGDAGPAALVRWTRAARRHAWGWGLAGAWRRWRVPR